MKRILFMLFALAILIPVARSQKTWTLEDCINHALDHNIQVKQYLLSVENAGMDLTQSKINLLPTLNAYVSHGWNWGKAIDRFTNQFATERVRSNNFYASSSVTLFNGFQKTNTIQKSKYDLEATRYEVDKFMDDISLNIALAYLQILYTQEYVTIAENQADITRQQVERMKKLVAAGTLAEGDLLMVEAQLAAEELQVVEAKNNFDLATLTLAQMLDLSSTDGFVIEKPEVEFYESNTMLLQPGQIFQVALGTQPIIKSKELRIRSAMKGYAIARGSQSPSLQMAVTWGTGFSGAQKLFIDPYFEEVQIGYDSQMRPVYSLIQRYGGTEIKPFADQISDNNNRTIDFRLNIPVFNGWYTRTSISKAKLAVRNAELDMESTKMQLHKTIQQAWADANASFKKFKASEKKVAASRESFHYAEQKFNVGMLTSFDYNNSKTTLLRAESELLQAKYDYIFKTKVLDFYMGLPLSVR